MKANNKIWMLMGKRLSGNITKKEIEQLKQVLQVNNDLKKVMDVLLQTKDLMTYKRDNEKAKELLAMRSNREQ